MSARLGPTAVALIGLLVGGGVTVATSPYWWPRLQRMSQLGVQPTAAGDVAEDPHDHSQHAGDSLELSSAALRNIGYEPLTVRPGEFTRTVTLPAMVVERPGRSQIQITAPLTGILTEIEAIQGAAVEPGAELFQIRLTHEELVAAQSDLLRTAGALDVVRRELKRLETIGAGVIPEKLLLEQQYERQRLESSLLADRQALVLHGLNDEQIEAILRDHKLLQMLTVRAPVHDHDHDSCQEDHLFHVQSLPVQPGEQVSAGQVLCVLADHCELYLEGRAFEDDIALLRRAAEQGWDVTASVRDGDRSTEVAKGLRLLFLADQVDPTTRAFKFYLGLPNHVALDQTAAGGTRFLDWRFKPGQRMELRIPVERWERRFVLPVEGVVEDGAESYVYRWHAGHFERVPVRVEYRDQRSVVVAQDGELHAGETIAARGAYQMHLALKNQAGGGVDPHAGHTH